jgi:hypothetical protein
MAKLTPITFKVKNETGETMEFKSDVSLTIDGTFNVTIPDELVESIGARVGNRRAGFDVELSKPATARQWRASGKRLDDVKSFIYAAMKDHLRCEVTTERIIAYGHRLKVSYARAIDGTFHTNGYTAQEAIGKSGAGNGEGYKWGGELNATEHAALYSVGLGARIFDKLTYRRPSGTIVKYQKPADFDPWRGASPGERLNGFIGISIDPEYSEQMPYTEEAAAFFYDAMMAMCRLADQVGAFLGDKQSLQLAIERRAGLLPAPQNTAAQPVAEQTT